MAAKKPSRKSRLSIVSNLYTDTLGDAGAGGAWLAGELWRAAGARGCRLRAAGRPAGGDYRAEWSGQDDHAQGSAGACADHGRHDRGERRGIARRGGHVAYVPQRDAINWRFPASVADVVLMGRYGRLGWFTRPSAADRAIARRCLEPVGMQALATRPIAALSGGQQQRVFLARALAQEQEVPLLDEPISGVDAPTQESILRILDDLADQGKTLLLTTHDLRCNMDHFDSLLALSRRVVALGPVEQVLTPAVLTHTYGTQVVLADGTSVALT